MDQASQKSRVRIFGEMVAVLPMGRRARPSRHSFGSVLEPLGDGTILISLVCLSHVEVFRGKRQRFSDRHIPTANDTHVHNVSSSVSG
jgi:hypothetical protein